MVLGSAWAFAGAILIIVIWGLTGARRFIIRIPGSSLLIPERQLLLS